VVVVVGAVLDAPHVRVAAAAAVVVVVVALEVLLLAAPGVHPAAFGLRPGIFGVVVCHEKRETA
jgi:hypothetical protein